MQKESAKKFFWRALEDASEGAEIGVEAALAALRFNADGLLPVVTQCAESGRVLMLAWVNDSALRQTLAQGVMVYYSRSRGELWRKGDVSGHRQTLVSLAADCDGDALLARVRQTGAACHTNRLSCFYARLAPAGRVQGDE